MITLITNWFVQTAAPQDYQRNDYLALWLILGVGTLLRFWGLGDVGLHGDEETMAMSAMAILETGQPVLPSGMYYSRALLNIYMMSGSVWLFGESEWAFRLPSAIVGSLAGLAAFFMGRRFLMPQLNLAFVATMTFLPGMIVVSQTARMYVFFAACILWFAASLFRWERDQRISSLIIALIVWLLCLHFHRLAIFVAPLFLFPGLSTQSWKLLIQGVVAAAGGALVFNVYANWISGRYPSSLDRPPSLEQIIQPTAIDALASANEWLFAASVLAIFVFVAVMIFKLARLKELAEAGPVLLVGGGLLAIVALHYHVGGILMLLGLAFWLRSPVLSRRVVVVPLLLAFAIAAFQLSIIYHSGLFPGRKIIGAVIGTPSIWPIFRFLTFSPVAGLTYSAVILVLLLRFINQSKFPVHFLLFVMAVWAPLLIIGYVDSYIPPRYAMGQLGFFLLCTFAGVAFVAREYGWLSQDKRLSRSWVVAISIISVALINPITLARTLNPDYDMYPDHKGAADYIQNLNPDSDFILIAEDILQQTYYLGKVDYWLREIDNANKYTILRDGRQVDFYTATPLLGTGAQLQSVLDNSEGRDIYILGSGENFVDGQRLTDLESCSMVGITRRRYGRLSVRPSVPRESQTNENHK